MTRWRLFYHIIWTTEERAPLIGMEIEPRLHRELTQKAISLKSSVLAINGMPDHIHIVAAIPPTVIPYNFIESLKAHSAQFMQNELKKPFKWQFGFGIVTVGRANLERIIAYVRNQKEHHATHATIIALETSSDEDDGPDPNLDLLS